MDLYNREMGSVRVCGLKRQGHVKAWIVTCYSETIFTTEEEQSRSTI